MSSATTLAELKSELDAQIQGGSLTLTAANSAADNVRRFVNTLPAQQLALTGASATLDGDAATLTVAGQVGDLWAIRGLDGEGVHVGRVTLVYTRPDGAFAAKLSLEGAINVGQTQVGVAGSLEPTGELRFVPGSRSGLTVSLPDLADFVSNKKLSQYLPPGVDIFGVVPVTALDFSFGYTRAAVTRFTFTSDMNAEWPIINNLASLKGVGVTLETKYQYGRAGGFQELIGGNVHGTLHLGQDFDVRLWLRGQSYWEVEVVPADGNALPGLGYLAGLVGGESLQNSVSAGLRNLGLQSVSLDAVAIGFSLSAGTIYSVAMRGHITVDEMTFNIQLVLPNFAFNGELSPQTPIKLKKLVGKYFAGADAFPEIDITTLGLSARPDVGSYEFHAAITTDWVLGVGPVSLGFKEFSFEINKDAAGVTGFVRGTFTLGEAELTVLASHPEVGAGWQFDGGTGPGQRIPIGDIIADIARRFGVDGGIPAPVAGLTVENLAVSFDTQTKEFKFACESKFPVEDKKVDIVVSVNLAYVGDSYTKKFGGHIRVGALTFDLVFSSDNASSTFLATYSHTGDKQGMDVKDLVASASTEVAGFIPGGLTVDLRDALFAFTKDAAGSTFILGLDLAASINLSNLPLVGQALPADQTVGVDDLQILVASKLLKQSAVTSLNSLIPAGVTKLPAADLARGLSVTAYMKFGAATQPLSLPVGGSSEAQPAAPPAPTAPTSVTAGSDNAKWFTIQRTFGPATFHRVGVEYREKAVWFLLDAALSFAGLTLSLDGLSVGSPLREFSPRFDLKGLGIEYEGGPISIGGAFLRRQVTSGGVTYDEYDGAAFIKTPQFGLSAIGSYAYLNGHPSLFIYAVLNYPLGGPSFFFVLGLAAGFGYNRSLRMPAIEQVAQFPLVAEAIAGTGTPKDLDAELQSLRQYIPPSTGNVFFAVGVKFTSFKIIDCFVLVTVSFGNSFELNLLGIATMISPPQPGASVPPLAVVQMAVRASFIPAEGFLGVQAQLTPASYILSRDCHITGGFAFFTWFSGPHEGDFVQTLGGYHPSFDVPAHYPRVPRLGINWQVSSDLSVKGAAYFALTPSALMAGGSLQATWQSGSLRAWFNAQADFIVAWKPYHYDAHISVQMGVSYTFEVDLWFTTIRKTISVDLEADLHIWGPKFSGKAHVKLWIVSFDVTFGDESAKSVEPVQWDEFRTSFLPAASKVCSLSVKSGLVPAADSEQWVINPTDFNLAINSAFPFKQVYKRNPLKPAAERDAAVSLSAPHSNAFGVAPMSLRAGSLSSNFYITVTRGGAWVGEEFDYVPVTKKVPTGLWGTSASASLNGQKFIEQALSGFELRPKSPPTPGETSDIDRASLQYDPENIDNAFSWGRPRAFGVEDANDEQRRGRIRSTIGATEVVAARRRLLDDLGLTQAITVGEQTADTFLIPPQVGALAV